MRTRGVLIRTAVALAVLVGSGAATAARAEALSFTIDVMGDGVVGSGSIVFPADAGQDSSGVDLVLAATLFGNAVTFTETDLVGIGWTGAAPGDLVPLVVDNLTLAIALGANTFLLSDNGGGAGDAVCTDVAAPFTACGGADIALAETTWTYTPPAAQVPGPSGTFAMLVGLALAGAWHVVRWVSRAES
jgi:hypothetical protein